MDLGCWITCNVPYVQERIGHLFTFSEVLFGLCKLTFIVPLVLPLEELFQFLDGVFVSTFLITELRAITHWIKTFARCRVTQQSFRQHFTCFWRQLLLFIELVHGFVQLTRYHFSGTFRNDTIRQTGFSFFSCSEPTTSDIEDFHRDVFARA